MSRQPLTAKEIALDSARKRDGDLAGFEPHTTPQPLLPMLGLSPEEPPATALPSPSEIAGQDSPATGQTAALPLGNADQSTQSALLRSTAGSRAREMALAMAGRPSPASTSENTATAAAFAAGSQLPMTAAAILEDPSLFATPLAASTAKFSMSSSSAAFSQSPGLTREMPLTSAPATEQPGLSQAALESATNLQFAHYDGESVLSASGDNVRALGSPIPNISRSPQPRGADFASSGQGRNDSGSASDASTAATHVVVTPRAGDEQFSVHIRALPEVFTDAINECVRAHMDNAGFRNAAQLRAAM